MGDILGFIAEYGVFPVAVGILFYLVLRIENNRSERRRIEQQNKQKMQEEQLQLEREQRLIDLIQKIDPQHTVVEQKKNKEINDFVLDRLNEIVDMGAQRAYIFSFHNGGKDVIGRGFLKMSIMAEGIGNAVSPIMAHYQNIPRTFLPNLYGTLEKSDCCLIDSIEDIKVTDPFTYQFLSSRHVSSAGFYSIKSSDGLFYGFVGVEYGAGPIQADNTNTKVEKEINKIIGATFGGKS